MRITKKTLLKVGAVPASAALMALAMPAAFAASSYNISAGTATGSVAWTATTTGTSPQVVFTDVTAGQTLTCASATASGTAKVGTGLSGTGIGSITGTTWTTCKGPLNLNLAVTGTHPWALNATGNTSAGSTPGTISGVKARVADTTGACAFDVTGSVAATWTNGTTSGTLDIPGTTASLTISNVSGWACSTLGIKNGNQAKFDATYTVAANTAGQNPIQITSNP